MSSTAAICDQIRKFYGEEERASDWVLVEQEQINRFGQSTHDMDWLHTNPERARNESPFGGTIAYGFWTVSMLTHLSRKLVGKDYPEGALYGINYGFDRLRWVNPVPVGNRIRLRTRLTKITPKDNQRYLVKSHNEIDVEGSDKPALVADWLFMLFYPPSA